MFVVLFFLRVDETHNYYIWRFIEVAAKRNEKKERKKNADDL